MFLRDTTMSYLRGPDRSKVQLPPPCLDDYVTDDSPARFSDVYAEDLDFAAPGFTHARPRDGLRSVGQLLAGPGPAAN